MLNRCYLQIVQGSNNVSVIIESGHVQTVLYSRSILSDKKKRASIRLGDLRSHSTQVPGKWLATPGGSSHRDRCYVVS
jgi:hypothetical protein